MELPSLALFGGLRQDLQHKVLRLFVERPERTGEVGDYVEVLWRRALLRTLLAS